MSAACKGPASSASTATSATAKNCLPRCAGGCDWCFHVAASYHLWLRDYAPMYAANVEGTRNVLEGRRQRQAVRGLFIPARWVASACPSREIGPDHADG